RLPRPGQGAGWRRGRSVASGLALAEPEGGNRAMMPVSAGPDRDRSLHPGRAALYFARGSVAGSTLAQGRGNRREPMESIVTLAIIGVTVLVSWRAFDDQRLLARLFLWPPAISRNQQYDRLVTHGFIHADWMHLLFNMITLFFF